MKLLILRPNGWAICSNPILLCIANLGQEYFHSFTLYIILCDGSYLLAAVPHWLAVTSDISRGLGNCPYLHFRTTSRYNYVHATGRHIGPFLHTRCHHSQSHWEHSTFVHYIKNNTCDHIWMFPNTQHIVKKHLCSLLVVCQIGQYSLTWQDWVTHIYVRKQGYHWFK